MIWSIVMRSKFHTPTVGWYDGSKCCWSTDSERAILYAEKEHAETMACSLKEKYPNIAKHIYVKMVR